MEIARRDANAGRRLRMPTVTLFAKAHDNFRPDIFNKSLSSTLEGLDVEAETCGATSRRWIQVSISGPDTTVALHYLDDRIGLCPESLQTVHKFSNLKGRIMDLSKERHDLRVDIGVFSPSSCDATVSLDRLRAQLVDGRSASFEKIASLFGFCEDMPFTVKIGDVRSEQGLVEAEVAEAQRKQYSRWAESLLDRLVILGASRRGIELAVERAGSKRDVLNIESLGLFEHVVVCKLGTDAVGLIPKIGKNLRKARFQS